MKFANQMESWHLLPESCIHIDPLFGCSDVIHRRGVRVSVLNVPVKHDLPIVARL